MRSISAQINIAPVDYPAILHMLPHQITVLHGAVDEILITFDTRRVRGSKLSAEKWEENSSLIKVFIENEIKPNFEGSTIVIDEIIYDLELRKDIGEYFFGYRRDVPLKDFRGGPFYAYYYGLYRAKNDLIFHLDADMMLVGDARRWLEEAVQSMHQDASIFACSPLLGPPADHDRLENYSIEGNKRYNPISKYHKPHSFLYRDFSTRAFFLDRNKLKGQSKVERPNFDHLIKAVLRGNPPVRFPEGTISSLIQKKGLWVLVFLGEGKGMWALHPLLTNEFKQRIPEVLIAINQGNYPDMQKGFPDVRQEFLDWIS